MTEEFNDSKVLDRNQRVNQADAKSGEQHGVAGWVRLSSSIFHLPSLAKSLCQCAHGSSLARDYSLMDTQKYTELSRRPGKIQGLTLIYNSAGDQRNNRKILP